MHALALVFRRVGTAHQPLGKTWWAVPTLQESIGVHYFPDSQ
jgi:hypothetical protein